MKFKTVTLIVSSLILPARNNIIDTLEDLDEQIVKTFRNPALQTGDQLLATLDHYNGNFSYLFHLLSEENENGTDTIHKLAGFVWLKGGPEFLKTKIDNELMKKTYSWDDESLTELYYYIGATHILWRDIQDLDRDDPYFRVPKNWTNDLLELDKKGLLNEEYDFTLKAVNGTGRNAMNI